MFFQMVPGLTGSATASIHCHLALSLKIPRRKCSWRLLRLAPELRFDDLAGFDAAGADANPLVSAIHLSLDWPKIHIPAALGYIVRMRNLVSELWTLTADLANLSHH